MGCHIHQTVITQSSGSHQAVVRVILNHLILNGLYHIVTQIWKKWIGKNVVLCGIYLIQESSRSHPRVIRESSESHPWVIKESSKSHQNVIRHSSDKTSEHCTVLQCVFIIEMECHHSFIRKSLRSHQAVQAIIRQSLGSHQAVIRHSSLHNWYWVALITLYTILHNSTTT
jgi:hypothetical protein